MVTDSVERIDVHGIFHNMVKESGGNLSQSIHSRLISRNSNAKITEAPIRINMLDSKNSFVPFSNYVDEAHKETTVR